MKDTNRESKMQKLGAAAANSPGRTMLTVLLVLFIIIGLFVTNYRAMALALGSTKGSPVLHGVGITFGQPFYSLWALYKVFIVGA